MVKNVTILNIGMINRKNPIDCRIADSTLDDLIFSQLPKNESDMADFSPNYRRGFEERHKGHLSNIKRKILDEIGSKYLEETYERIIEDLQKFMDDYVSKNYGNLKLYSTFLRQNDIDLLCATMTMSLGKSAASLAEKMNFNTNVNISVENKNYQIDLESYLRKLQNKLYEHYVKELGYNQN